MSAVPKDWRAHNACADFKITDRAFSCVLFIKELGGQLKNKTVEDLASEAPPLFQHYIDYLKSDCGLMNGTIHNRKGPLVDFFRKHRWLKTSRDARRLKPRGIQRYVREQASGQSVERRKAMMTALRNFLRYLRFKRYHPLDLSMSVPCIVTYSRSTTPRPLPLSTAKRLVKVPDRRRAIGRRDYAILLLFLKYGVRSKQVVNLLIKDIDWRAGTIHFHAMKGGKPVVVPMDGEVANALLEYLKRDRQDTTYPYVFVKHQTGPTYGQPLGRALWFMVSRHLEAAGLPVGHRYRGPHALRHTVATELLRKEQPIKTIADLLGQRNINTASIYTKVDIASLRKLERPWPGATI
jgi:integrase/recombinase XerD